MKQTQKYQKLQFPRWPLEAGAKSESVLIEPQIKMSNITAELHMLIALNITWLFFIANFYCS